jgi:hypothetical protein
MSAVRRTDAHAQRDMLDEIRLPHFFCNRTQFDLGSGATRTASV